MQGGKNWILPKEANAYRFFSLAGNLEKHLCPSMGPNRESVAADSEAGVSVPEVGRLRAESAKYVPARQAILPRRTGTTLAD